MNIKTALQTLLEHQNLSAECMDAAMHAIMTGQASPAQIGAFLIALRMKGETVTEIAAAAKVMRSLAVPVKVESDYLVDTCGTGGDSAKTFNISTVSALVAAAAGAHVAKHGNRAVSGNSGSADVLKEAGVNLELTPDQVARCIEHVGVGFLFAPLHHSAMKHAVAPRRELGVRTVFNLLGPLTNPAGAPNQVVGVFSRAWVRPMAEVLQALGSRHVMVVHAQDGLDEISHASETHVAELKEGQISTYEIKPEDYGIRRGHLADISVDSVQQSLEMINQVLKNQPGPALDIVMLNAGAAIYVSGVAKSFQAGIDMAEDAITTGLAREKFSELVQFSLVNEQGECQ